MSLGVAALALAGCAPPQAPHVSYSHGHEHFSQSKYGHASRKVVADGEAVPRGGGQYLVGRPYTVAGHRYYPAENPSYTAIGMASWYGAAFHGRRTASIAQRLLEVLEDLGVVPVQVGLRRRRTGAGTTGRGCRRPPRCGSTPGRRTSTPSCSADGCRPARSVTEHVSRPLVADPGSRPAQPETMDAIGAEWLGTRSIVTCMPNRCAPSTNRSSALDAPEQRVDVTRIGDVVAVVGHRRDHHRVQPDRVDAERLEVVQPGGHAVEVTDTVAVAVHEGPRIRLVEERVRPPRSIDPIHERSLCRSGRNLMSRGRVAPPQSWGRIHLREANA